MSQGPECPAGCPAPARERIGFLAPAIIVGFIALTLVGTYFVRLRLLENAMSAAVEMDDKASVVELAHCFPCPVNAWDKDGRTPLHGAAKWGDLALAEWLLRKGADVNAEPDVGWTPLHEAAEFGKKEVAELLIAKGADINARDYKGGTPLHWAASCGKKEIVDLLIAKGADISLRDYHGNTPLQWAIGEKSDAVAEVLRKAGAKE